MKYGALVFLAAFFALSASWLGYVLTPQIQLGREPQATNSANTAELYPQSRPGLARQGADVYRANGCAYCHSQQVQQTGVVADVVLTDAGTNLPAVVKALAGGGDAKVNSAGLAGGLPKAVLKGVGFDLADAVTKALKAAGAKAELRIVATGPDIARGWGRRRTVAEDFLFDYPVMLGAQRVGPDLANIGQRRPDPNWQLRHLYAPAAEVEGSPMPAYKFLFETRNLAPGQPPAPGAIPLTAAGTFFDPAKDAAADRELVPTPDATALVAYLMSLHADVPLWSAPMAAPAPRAGASVTNTAAQ